MGKSRVFLQSRGRARQSKMKKHGYNEAETWQITEQQHFVVMGNLAECGLMVRHMKCRGALGKCEWMDGDVRSACAIDLRENDDKARAAHSISLHPQHVLELQRRRRKVLFQNRVYGNAAVAAIMTTCQSPCVFIKAHSCLAQWRWLIGIHVHPLYGRLPSSRLG